MLLLFIDLLFTRLVGLPEPHHILVANRTLLLFLLEETLGGRNPRFSRHLITIHIRGRSLKPTLA